MDYAVLAAQLAVSAASIAAVIFIPPPFGFIVSTAVSLAGNLAIQGATGDWSPLSTIMSIVGASLSILKETGTIAKIGAQIGKQLTKIAPKAVETFNKISLNFKKITDSINKKINNLAPNKVIAKAVEKWGGRTTDTLFDDTKLIMQKTSELETFGEVRTDKKINSTKFNPNTRSWIQCAHFEETKFINRNSIIGTLTIFYYVNNGSRLNERKNPALNGNTNVIAISIPNARYKNDYVSGICRAKSWGSYYMRTWMIGKAGRSPEGINTAIFFGTSWRVDKRLKNLLNQYKNLDKVAINYSVKTAEKFIGKTKIGTKLLSYKDVYTKTKSAVNNVKSGNLNFLKSHIKKWKGLKK